MSSLTDRFAEPIFLVSLAIFAAVTTGIYFASDDNLFLALIGGVLIAGAVYILYQDYVEKQLIKERENQKEQDLNRRRKAQAEAEYAKGKCISCITELPEGAKECPNCGFKVKHYSTDDQ